MISRFSSLMVKEYNEKFGEITFRQIESLGAIFDNNSVSKTNSDLTFSTYDGELS